MEKFNSIIILGVLLIGVFSFLLINQYQEFNQEPKCRILVNNEQVWGLGLLDEGNINQVISKMEKDGESFDLKIKTTCGLR